MVECDKIDCQHNIANIENPKHELCCIPYDHITYKCIYKKEEDKAD